MNKKRTHRRMIQVPALMAVLVLAASTHVYANPVRFDNPPGGGHFVWYGGTPSYPVALDMTLDAPSQTGVATFGPTEFHQSNEPGTPNNFVSGALNSELQVGGPYGDMLLGVDFGDPIPSGLAWRTFGYIYYPGDPWFLPEGVETYLGVTFSMVVGGDMHYGWIGIVRTDIELDAFAWGYETDAGVPIAAGVPEPGSLALLALGAAGVAGRRRRRS